jgi:ABC-type Fe3+/spermidine/putrescine transport system ATPase subunit
VRGVSLEIPAGSFFSLLGPSGCGKSTTLRMIAGFELPDRGSITIGARDITRASPQRRPTAMVFQNYALFPHMTVAENVEYGLRVRKVERSERTRRVAEALESVEMGGMESTPVTSLSGGQQQRVALARAVAVRPSVLLFDEPLSNLDVALREQTRRELKRLQTTLGITSIYVTHDQEEALSLSDRMAVMRAGEIVQEGAPEDVYQRPATAFVAGFLGGSNLLEARHATLVTGSEPENGMLLAVRPEHVVVDDSGRFEGKVLERQFLGSSSTLWLDWEGTQLRMSAQSDVPLLEQVRFDIRAGHPVRDDR